MEQAADARRGVRAMVRVGDRMRMLCVLARGESLWPSSWARVHPAQPVPRMARVGLLLKIVARAAEVVLLRVLGAMIEDVVWRYRYEVLLAKSLKLEAFDVLEGLVEG